MSARDVAFTLHVKNILHKLHANTRAEAASRSLRLTLGRDPKGNA